MGLRARGGLGGELQRPRLQTKQKSKPGKGDFEESEEVSLAKGRIELPYAWNVPDPARWLKTFYRRVGSYFGARYSSRPECMRPWGATWRDTASVATTIANLTGNLPGGSSGVKVLAPEPVAEPYSFAPRKVALAFSISRTPSSVPSRVISDFLSRPSTLIPVIRIAYAPVSRTVMAVSVSVSLATVKDLFWTSSGPQRSDSPRTLSVRW